MTQLSAEKCRIRAPIGARVMLHSVDIWNIDFAYVLKARNIQCCICQKIVSNSKNDFICVLEIGSDGACVVASHER